MVSDRHRGASMDPVIASAVIRADASNGPMIDGIPPGSIHAAWHPAWGFADDSVTVLAGHS